MTKCTELRVAHQVSPPENMPACSLGFQCPNQELLPQSFWLVLKEHLVHCDSLFLRLIRQKSWEEI